MSTMTPEQMTARISELEGQLSSAQTTASERKAELTRVQAELTRTTTRAESAEARATQAESDAAAATERHTQEVQQIRAEADTRYADAQKEVVSAELRAEAFAAGMVAPEDITRFVDVSTFERDDSGKVIGISEAVEGLKGDRAYLFAAPAAPAAGSGQSAGTQTSGGNPAPGTTSPGQRRATPPASGEPQTVANLDDTAYAAVRNKVAPGYRRQ